MTPPPQSHAEALKTANRIILGLILAIVALFVVAAHLALRKPEAVLDRTLFQDPAVRAEVARELARIAAKSYDSHPDPDVGRLMLADLKDREESEMLVSTNSYGMREREYALPKPDDVLRVVVLGDSMVYGLRAAAEDRMGAHLKRFLQERAPAFEGRIECLHFGISSWNIASEAAFLRRQLSELQPDLVIHLIVPNDLDDSGGVRGFGGQATFSPQRRDRADSLVKAGYARSVLGFDRQGLLYLGLDGESRTRYREAAETLLRLAEAIEASGGSYRLLVHFRSLGPIARRFLEPALGVERVVYLEQRFTQEERFRTGGSDMHWNRLGHERVALLIYGLIARDQLLPMLDLPEWDEATQLLDEVAGKGLDETSRVLRLPEILRRAGKPEIRSALDFPPRDAHAAAQIHGGVDLEGLTSPYASILLALPEGDSTNAILRIRGAALARPEIDDARVRVYADNARLGEIVLRAGERIEFEAPLPKTVTARKFFSLRLEADDWVYVGEDLRHCVVFRLERAEAIPASTS